MARRHREDLQDQIRKLQQYGDEEDLEPSAVHHLAVLAAKASESKSTSDKIIRVFSETVAAVPAPDRVKLLYAIIAGLVTIILAGMALKAAGLW